METEAQRLRRLAAARREVAVVAEENADAHTREAAQWAGRDARLEALLRREAERDRATEATARADAALLELLAAERELSAKVVEG